MTKISDLTEATSVSASDTLLLSVGGVDKKVPISSLEAYIAETYSRPGDWLEMPVDAANKMSILIAVWPDDTLNYYGLNMTITGGYTVDWGDGTAPEAVASGVQANHNYTYADGDLAGTECSRGYKQAIIVITPTAAGAFTTVSFAVKNASLAALETLGHSFLDMQLNIPSCTTLTIRSSTVAAYALERVNFTGLGAITSAASLFSICYGLQEVTFPSGSLAAVTTIASMFQLCINLRSVTFPEGSLASVTTLSSTFNGCSLLKEVSFPAGSLGAVTTMADAFASCVELRSLTFPAGSLDATLTNITGAFANCQSIESITFPSGSLSAVTSLASTFQNCYNLPSFSFPSGSLASVTSIASVFVNCRSMDTITFPTGSLGSCTNMATAFSGCTLLTSISFPASSLATCTSINSTFNGCSLLTSVTFPTGAFAGALDMSLAFINCGQLQSITFPTGWAPSGAHTFSVTFSGCSQLGNIDNAAFKESFSIASCHFSATALNEIYTALPTATKTITVSSNYGTTGDDPTIATAKNWTVTG